MSIVLAAVWICLFCCVTAIVLFWIEQRSGTRRLGRAVDPEQLLAERYARGELDEHEYARRLSVLRVGPPLHAYLDQ